MTRRSRHIAREQYAAECHAFYAPLESIVWWQEFLASWRAIGRAVGGAK